MKYLFLLLFSLLFSGCLYFNDTGVSTRLYDGCKEYYDAEGNYIKECPNHNIIDYKDLDNCED
jgi:hypothetical protein